MLETFWHDWLYTPLFNSLIFLYSGPALYNMGLAVVYLTVILRVLLLPLSIIAERNKVSYEKVAQKIKTLEKDFRAEPVKKKEMIRKLLKEYSVSPWAKVMVLGSQLLVLILLYQVFLGGINLVKFDVLYSFVIKPDFINTKFLTIDLSQTNLVAAALVGVVLYLETLFIQRRKKEILTRSDILFRYFFPLAIFGVLLLLPAVKSLFILTSIFFSLALFILTRIYYKIKDKVVPVKNQLAVKV